MKELSIINAGYIGGFLDDHKNYEERIAHSKPIEAENFNVTSIYYGDIGFNFNFGNKSVGLDAALGANVTDDIIAWLEAICMGYEESILLLDAEGPLQMFRLYSHFEDTPRFTIFTSREYYFIDDEKPFVFNDETEEKFYKSDETQIVCDIFISKKKFVQQLWNAIQNALELTPDKEYEERNANPPIRNSEIIKRFLEK